MAKIKVHILNFHNVWSHLELMLENTSIEPHQYFSVNRWSYPQRYWSVYGKSAINVASSIYSFEIDADPDVITKEWNEYWRKTEPEANIATSNCAVAAQWFLNRFAGIPNPSLSNVSLNHFAFGIMWPSFIPSPITLPGRIMSNAKFHIEERNQPEASLFMRLFIYTSLALATLALAASIFALTVAATVMSGGLAALAISASVVAIGASSYGFFKAYNATSATMFTRLGPKKTDAPARDKELMLVDDDIAALMGCAIRK